VTIFSSKRRMTAAAALILLLLFLLRPGASRLKSRIISSISAGVGRPVDIGSVHIQLLPRPGFDLENLVVYDDPAFGAEPILRASEVTAALRLTSLVRGRLEIARLDLNEPSLNLVHNETGRWNLEALLERTARIPLAPTGKAKTEPRPAFPYIEATSARINFKNGYEKTPYALTNADFSLWQDSENAWGVRLKAQPVRTDLNLNGTGQLQISGTWQRAQTLSDTPLQFNVEWSKAQLGQVTKFLAGNDKGWRGAIQLDVALSGTPAKLRISSSGSIEDFRRYDITSGRALRLAASCDGEYSSLAHEFHEVLCSAPMAQGLITLTGDVGLPGSHRYAVMVRAENVPANTALMLVERAKKDLSDDLEAEGTIRGDFSLQEDAPAGARPRLEGRGEINDFRLASASNKAEIGPETVPFFVIDDAETSETQANRRGGLHMRVPQGPHIEFGPFPIGAGRPGAAMVRGWLTRAGYDLTVAGEAEIARTLRLARMIGVAATPTTAEGTAQVDLQIAGSWTAESGGSIASFAGPQAIGTAKLRNVQIVARGVGGPVEISSADIQFLPDKVHVGKLNAKAAGTNWTGTLDMPRGCGTSCAVRFVLNADQIALSRLSEWASPSPKKQPWYRVLDSGKQAGPSPLASLHASGRVTTDRLEIHGVAATRVSANVSLDNGKLQISSLDSDFMDGKHRGEWQADFTVKPAVCKGSGKLSGLSLGGFADAMHDDWIAGTADANYEVKGKCPAEFWQSAEGTIHVDMTDGIFPHVLLGDNAEPFRVARLAASATLRGGTIGIKNATLDAPDGQYELSGTAALTRDVELRLMRVASGTSASGYAITGTLAEPQVAPLTNAEQAHLKPLPAK
jgi:hypothetical protein